MTKQGRVIVALVLMLIEGSSAYGLTIWLTTSPPRIARDVWRVFWPPKLGSLLIVKDPCIGTAEGASGLLTLKAPALLRCALHLSLAAEKYGVLRCAQDDCFNGQRAAPCAAALRSC